MQQSPKPSELLEIGSADLKPPSSSNYPQSSSNYLNSYEDVSCDSESESNSDTTSEESCHSPTVRFVKNTYLKRSDFMEFKQ